jgi:hypothetical protein
VRLDTLSSSRLVLTEKKVRREYSMLIPLVSINYRKQQLYQKEKMARNSSTSEGEEVVGVLSSSSTFMTKGPSRIFIHQ